METNTGVHLVKKWNFLLWRKIKKVTKQKHSKMSLIAYDHKKVSIYEATTKLKYNLLMLTDIGAQAGYKKEPHEDSSNCHWKMVGKK